MVTLLCMPEARLHAHALCKLVIHTIYALPAAGYNAWIHHCMHAVKSILCARHVRMYNPWGSIVCREQSMDCLDRARYNPQIIAQFMDPYFAQDNLRIIPIHTLCITYIYYVSDVNRRAFHEDIRKAQCDLESTACSNKSLY